MKHLQSVKSKLSIVLAAALFSGILPLGAQRTEAATIRDIKSCSDYSKEAVLSLTAQDIIKGGSNGYFNPLETLTRGHMVIMIARALGYDLTNIPSTPTFKDVPASHWAYPYVEAAYREGIITKGSSGLFGINDKCTREQMAIMFVRSLGLKDAEIKNKQELINTGTLKDKSKISSWAKDQIEFIMATGLMGGKANNNFGPQDSASREQAAVVIYRYLNSRSATSELAKAVTSSPVQYPELYEAIKNNSLGYKGELNSKITLNMSNKSLNEDVSLDFSNTASVNNLNSHLKSTLNFNATGIPSSTMEYESISIDKKLFMKLPGESKWLLVPAAETALGDTSAISTEVSKIKFEQLIRSYGNLSIANMGNTEVNGVLASKYELTLNKEAFKTLFSALTAEGYFDQESDIAELLKKPYEGKAEIYLDQQNRIIKEKFDFTANIKYEDTGDDIYISSSAETNYTNIGAEIEIKAPSISEISTTGSAGSM